MIGVDTIIVLALLVGGAMYAKYYIEGGASSGKPPPAPTQVASLLDGALADVASLQKMTSIANAIDSNRNRRPGLVEPARKAIESVRKATAAIISTIPEASRKAKMYPGAGGAFGNLPFNRSYKFAVVSISPSKNIVAFEAVGIDFGVPIGKAIDAFMEPAMANLDNEGDERNLVRWSLLPYRLSAMINALCRCIPGHFQVKALALCSPTGEGNAPPGAPPGDPWARDWSHILCVSASMDDDTYEKFCKVIKDKPNCWKPAGLQLFSQPPVDARSGVYDPV